METRMADTIGKNTKLTTEELKNFFQQGDVTGNQIWFIVKKLFTTYAPHQGHMWRLTTGEQTKLKNYAPSGYAE